MHYLIAFIYFLFALIGIDGHGSHTIVTRSASNGVDVLYSRTRVIGGLAEVACISSVSGRCHYQVLPGDCVGSQSARRRLPRCAPDPARQFALPAGSTRELAGLPPQGFVLCVSHDNPASGSDCEQLSDTMLVLP